MHTNDQTLLGEAGIVLGGVRLSVCLCVSVFLCLWVWRSVRANTENYSTEIDLTRYKNLLRWTKEVFFCEFDHDF